MPTINNRFNEIINDISNHPYTQRINNVINNEVRNEPRIITIRLDSLPAFLQIDGITYCITYCPTFEAPNDIESYFNIIDRAIEESEFDINEFISEQLSQKLHHHKGLKYKPQIMINYYIKYIWYNKFIRIKSNKQKRNIYGCTLINENDNS